jgi:hypothetical protein
MSVENIDSKDKTIAMSQDYTLDDINRIEDFRSALLGFEEQLANVEGSYGSATNAGQNEVMNEINPIVHTFGEGFYMREISMPKGQLMTTGIHKKEHPFFILKGDVSVLTDEGLIRITAPHRGVTKPGTKRLIYMHEDTVWITVHITDKKTIEEIHADVIAKDFNDPEVSLEKAKEMLQIKSDKS